MCHYYKAVGEFPDYCHVSSHCLPTRIAASVSHEAVARHHQSLIGSQSSQAKQAVLNLLRSWPLHRASVFDVTVWNEWISMNEKYPEMIMIHFTPLFIFIIAIIYVKLATYSLACSASRRNSSSSAENTTNSLFFWIWNDSQLFAKSYMFYAYNEWFAK